MQLDIEPEVSPSVYAYLSKVGHIINDSSEGSGFAAVTAIGVRDGIPEPFFDRRRVGSTSTVSLENKMVH